MKALFLVADGFEDIQFFVPFYRLQEEGVTCTVTSVSDGRLVTGLHGYVVEPDMPIPELNPSEYDVLIIPGGRSPEKLRLREDAVDLTRTFIQEGTLVAAIGHGPQLLLSAGAIDNKIVTCSPSIRDDVKCAGATYRDGSIVVDGSLITARSSDDLPEFCGSIISGMFANTR
jgi:protease I